MLKCLALGECRNWQTGMTEDHVPQGVGVRVPASPPNLLTAMPSTKVSIYRETLKSLSDWEPFLMTESGLPGPRGNLELAQAVFDEGNIELFEHLLTYTPDKAPVKSPQEFLHFCGVFGHGKYLTKDSLELWERLRIFASDPRWRTREAVAMALQAYGDRDMCDLIEKMNDWALGNRYQQRTAAAGLCEPRLLKRPENAEKVLVVLNVITASMVSDTDRRTEDFKILRRAMGYCWSVAVSTSPEKGKHLMENWLQSDNADVRWIMKENLSKNRLVKMDADWVHRWTG
jgi:hypothetical protein